MPDRHAILAPSSSARWLACPASARLEEREPNKDTVFTREGTTAHAFAERCLDWLKETNAESVGECPERLRNALKEECAKDRYDRFDWQEMASAVWDNYVRIVYEDFLTARASDPDAILLVEQMYSLREYVPESFGSSDAVIISGDTLSVYDLKYGKGVKVSAWGNTQMRLYALGAFLAQGELYDITSLRATIIQPRLGWVSTDAFTACALLDWAEKELRPKAALAYQGIGPTVPGAHCRFCKVAHKCKALADLATQCADVNAETLDNDGIADYLRKAPVVRTWLDAVEGRALEAALNGERFPGFKLVEGRSVRAISDKEQAIVRLASRDYLESVYLKAPELRTITELEKNLTKKGFKELLGDLVIKPKGKPTLVPEDDPRPEINNAGDDFNDIINTE